jgi:tripartite-type tricarboxylate transporter receptor subunit TctC
LSLAPNLSGAKMGHRVRSVLIAGLAAGLVVTHPARAQTVEAFYRGKSIDIYIGTAPSDGPVGAYARALAQVMGQYIPGRPNLIIHYMPGAGGLKAANFMYAIAPQDGTAWGFITRGFVRAPLLRAPGADYDASRFNWIGSTARETTVAGVWATATRVRTISEAMREELVFGGTSLATDTGLFPTVLNRLIGTRFKVVVGYRASPEVDLAIERGEVQGKMWTWGALKSGRTAGWLAEKKVYLLVQTGLTKAGDLPDVPLALDLARTPRDRQVMELIFSPISIGYPSFMGPGVPKDRVAALRQAFAQTMRDPEFARLLQPQSLPFDPISGEEVQKIVESIYAMPQEAIARARELVPASE